MTNFLAVAIAVAVMAFLAAASMLASSFLRDKRRAQREGAVSNAAQVYLASFDIRARIVAVTLSDQRIALMVETPPHKKLRFSHIIEQPIKHFVFKQTQIEVDRLFWRFPLPAKNAQGPEVQYGVTTTTVMPDMIPPSLPKPQKTPEVNSPQDEEDDYFKRQAYQIEEVSWEDYSAISKSGPSHKQDK